jgi:hypothetical protein
MKSMRMMAVAGLLLMAREAAAPAAEIHGT